MICDDCKDRRHNDCVTVATERDASWCDCQHKTGKVVEDNESSV